jgi:hypothetical protein
MNESHDSRQPFRVISWLDHARLAPEYARSLCGYFHSAVCRARRGSAFTGAIS